MTTNLAGGRPRRRKIVHLTSAHPPTDTRIFVKMCRTLADAGYDVALVAPADRDGVESGVRIRAVPRAASRRERMLGTAWKVYRAALDESADLYHFHDPELIPWALLLRARGKRVVMDVHEDLPKQIYSKHWVPERVRPLVAFLVGLADRLAAKGMSVVVAATPSIAQRFPGDRTVLVQNFPMVAELESGQIRYADRARAVAYVGVITEPRGVRELVQALHLLPDDGTTLLLAGQFDPPELEAEVRTHPGWSRVEYVGQQSREGVRDLLGRARAGVVAFRPDPNHLMAQPNKFYEYMSAGLPVVASDFPAWRALVDGAGCGLLVDPLDPASLAEAIAWLLDHPAEAEEMGSRGRREIEQSYNWRQEADRLISTYRRALGD